MPFNDRPTAGIALAHELRKQGFGESAVVAGVPRGGVFVAAALAKELQVPLDVVVVNPVTAPGRHDYVVGAVAETAVHLIDDEALETLGVREDQLAQRVARETADLARLMSLYRAGYSPLPVNDRTVIVVDDGSGTGVIAKAAAQCLHNRGAQELILAVPVCSVDAAVEMRKVFDRVVSLIEPDDSIAVELWYDSFAEVTEEAVAALLADGDHSSTPV